MYKKEKSGMREYEGKFLTILLARELEIYPSLYNLYKLSTT